MKLANIIILLFALTFQVTLAQNFQDNLTHEAIGDFPSNWDLVGGLASIDQTAGNKFISIHHGGIIKPIVNDQTNNYINGDFTIELDIFFDTTSSLYGQRFYLRLWDGAYAYQNNDIRYKPFAIYRDGLETDWNQPEMGNAKNHLTTLQTLDAVWRHLKVECNSGKLKILLDEQLVLFLPRFKMQPTMVSIGGGINDSRYPAKIGFTNFMLYGSQLSESSTNTSPNETQNDDTSNSDGTATNSTNTTSVNNGAEATHADSDTKTVNTSDFGPSNPSSTLGTGGINPNSDSSGMVSYDVGLNNNTNNSDLSDIKYNRPLKKIELQDQTKGNRIIQVKPTSFIERNTSTSTNLGEQTVGSEKCSTTKLTLSANNESFNEFVTQNFQGWMLPGAILKADHYISDRKTVIYVDRKPITLTTNLINAQQSSFQVNNPGNLSELQDAVRQIQMLADAHVASNISFDYHEIHSKEDLEFKIYGKYKGTNIQAELDLDFTQNKETHYYMMDMTQSMFTIYNSKFDMFNTFVNDTNVHYNNLLYVSSVTYGRRAIAIIESDLDVKDFNLSINGYFSAMKKEASLESDISYFNSKNNFKMKAVFYGGIPGAAFEAIEASNEAQRLNLSRYFKEGAGDPRYALPISYKLTNLEGAEMGYGSSFNQTLTRCVPINSGTKLKVTLTDLQCINKRDGGNNPDDYALRMALKYVANGSEKNAISSEWGGKYPNDLCVWDVPVYENNKLACGDQYRQIHLPESRIQTNNINNAITFNLTAAELADANATMTLYSWLKEYTDGNDLVLYNSSIQIKISDILTDLMLGDQAHGFTLNFFDDAVSTSGKYKSYGYKSTEGMWLRRSWISHQEYNPKVLEGPIVLGTKTTNDGNRGAAWIKFELLPD
ncbi:thiol-activated cytolysin family protein [Litoribaculum gwangyangense]|uniref:3-keto-disaccharide hydrolase domain-containing protein n=1 Tax=Litoribaculum gwangyangense TaxID=1130722 RepID=A0ABP9CG81_9FLAO